MPRIFISYRRADSGAITGRIFDKLQPHFGDRNVILDIDSIPYGVDFKKIVESEIKLCDAFIAIIGKKWARDGERWRLNEKNDLVRLEVEAALARGIPLIPVLVEGAVMPGLDDLPESIRPLADRNAAEVDVGRDFHMHVDRIIRSLDEFFPSVEPAGVPESDGGTRSPPDLTGNAKPQTREEGWSWKAGDEARQAPDEIAAAVPIRQSDTGRRPVPRISLAERLERISERHQTVNLTVFALVGGFLLCMASAVADVHLLSRIDHGVPKQVGFLSAPNWVITYLILLPLYLMLFSILMRQRKRLLRQLAEFRSIVRADGSNASADELLDYWNRSLGKVSLVLWAFVLTVSLQAAQEWGGSCLVPLYTRTAANRMVDWSIIAADGGTDLAVWKGIFFTGFAYIYMGFALFIYLAVMLYGVAIAAFLNHLSEGSGELRLIRLHPQLLRATSGAATTIYACTALGLCAAYVMRLQAGYLASTDPNVFTFFISKDVIPLLSRLGLASPAIEPPPGFGGAHINSEWTSLLVAAYALAMFALSMFLLYQALIVDKGDRQPEVSDEAERTPGHVFRFSTILPGYRHLLLALSVAVVACVLVGAGVLWLAAMAYAIWALARNSAAAKRELNSRPPIPTA